MNCTVCHGELPPGARACPNCGTLASAYGTTSYNDETMGSSHNNNPQPPSSGIGYGSDPYRTPSQYNPPPPQYNSPVQRGYSSPNNAPVYDQRQQRPAYAPPPSYQPVQPQPPRPQQRGKKIWLIAGIGLLIVVLLIGGSIFIISNLTNSNNNSATSNPYPPRTGKLIFNDPMVNNSQGNKWDETVIHDIGNPTCGFKSNAYHMTSSATLKEQLVCEPEAQNLYFSNIAFEAKLTVVRGESAGILVRVDQTTTSGFLFTVDTSGNYHLYDINWKSSNASQHQQELGRGGNSGAINKGLNATNLLAIVANGSAISIYANGSFLESALDSAHINGQIGVYGESQSALDVVAADARVWQL